MTDLFLSCQHFIFPLYCTATSMGQVKWYLSNFQDLNKETCLCRNNSTFPSFTLRKGPSDPISQGGSKARVTRKAQLREEEKGLENQRVLELDRHLHANNILDRSQRYSWVKKGETMTTDKDLKFHIIKYQPPQLFSCWSVSSVLCSSSPN